MAFNEKETIVPLYINSVDRLDPGQSSTNFNISLRKSLRFISSINVSNVGIPKTFTNININNNLLIGMFCDGTNPGVTYPFEILIPPAQYTPIEYKDELQLQLNDNVVSALFNLTWIIDFDNDSNLFSITTIYPNGALAPEWGFDIIYTPMVDVLGLGPGGTTTLSLRVGPNADTLVFDIQRVPALYNNLHINITSSALTGDINTSYVKSFGKAFNIETDSKVSTGNDTFTINTTQTFAPYQNAIPIGTGATQNLYQGYGIAMSGGDSTYIGFCAPGDLGGVGATWVFKKNTPDSFYLQQGLPKIIPTDTNGQSNIRAVAISSNGQFMIVGGRDDDSNRGAAWLFRRAGVEWIQAFPKITDPSGAAAGARQGTSVAISEDGSTIAVGGDNYNSNQGATWVYVMEDNEYKLEQLISEALPGVRQGFSIALSHNGDILAIGAIAEDTNVGAVRVYTRTAGVWTQQGPKIQDGTAVNDLQGISVSFDANGTTLAVGATGSDLGGPNSVGSVRIYIEIAGVWTQQGPVLQDPAQGQRQGVCALSDDGNVLIVGASGFPTTGPNPGTGRIYIYTRTGVVWNPVPFIIAPGLVASRTGESVAISGDGNTVAFSATNTGGRQGRVLVYVRDGINWVPYGDPLIGNDGVGVSRQGSDVVVSEDGTILLVGGDQDFGQTGSVWVYVRDNFDWIQKQKLTVSGQNNGQYGRLGTMSISSDGNTIAVGGPLAGPTFNGQARVYIRTAGVWNVQLILQGSAINMLLGWSTTLSGSGDILVVGYGQYDTAGRGAFDIYTRTDGLWTQLGSTVTGAAFDELGRSLSMSRDGLSFAVGAPGAVANRGYVRIYSFDSGAYNLEQTIIPPAATNGSLVGYTVDMSRDGTTIVIGAPGDNASTGAVWVYSLVAGVWTEQAFGKIVGPGAVPGSNFGRHVSISQDGNIIAVGGDNHNSSKGAVWTYVKDSGVAWSFVSPLLETPELNGRLGVSVAVDTTKGGIIVYAGAPFENNDTGRVYQFFNNVTFDIKYIVTVPTRAYSIFDLVNELEQLLQFETMSFEVEFDMKTETLTYTAVPVSGVTVSFSVDPNSTFNKIIPFELIKNPSDTQRSEVIDFSINNNIIKSVNTHQDDEKGLIIYDTVPPKLFRKYRAGYTIKDTDIVDIQLRDERDRIIDLGGANWIMTVFATIRD